MTICWLRFCWKEFHDTNSNYQPNSEIPHHHGEIGRRNEGNGREEGDGGEDNVWIKCCKSFSLLSVYIYFDTWCVEVFENIFSYA